PRINYGLEKLGAALADAGYVVVVKGDTARNGLMDGLLLVRMAGSDVSLPGEAFRVRVTDLAGNGELIGGDATGVLYGCLELADRIAENNEMPAGLELSDQPEMVLR